MAPLGGNAVVVKAAPAVAPPGGNAVAKAAPAVARLGGNGVRRAWEFLQGQMRHGPVVRRAAKAARQTPRRVETPRSSNRALGAKADSTLGGLAAAPAGGNAVRKAAWAVALRGGKGVRRDWEAPRGRVHHGPVVRPATKAARRTPQPEMPRSSSHALGAKVGGIVGDLVAVAPRGGNAVPKAAWAAARGGDAEVRE